MPSTPTVTFEDVEQAGARITPFLPPTPLLANERLDAWLGHRFVFKPENLQRTGSFKARGALNTLLWLKERGELPKRVVAFSLGNHSQGVAWAAAKLGIPATICLPENASALKIQATEGYGAKVLKFPTRQEAEAAASEEEARGAYRIPPFDHDQIIAGQGTACLEALRTRLVPNAVVVPVGGGGLFSGTFVAARALTPKAKVIGVEPKNANDAARSIREGKIVRLESAPQTIADGVRTLAVAERTFAYLRQADAFYEIEEQGIIYWTQWLTHLLKLTVEPTSALAMAAAVRWAAGEPKGQTVLVILSGGNIDPECHRAIWETSQMEYLPSSF